MITYEKLWGALALPHRIDIPHSFRVGLFLDAIIRRQEKELEILGMLYGDVLEDRTLVEDSIHSANLRLADIEAQGVYHFTEWKDYIQAAVGQVKAAEISVKTPKQELIEFANSSTKHDGKLGIIFNIFAAFRSSI